MYFAFGSMTGNTFVSDAAANTVGWESPDASDELVDCEDERVVALGLLLPQPTTNEQIAIAAATTAVRPARGAVRISECSFMVRQYLSTLLESWQ